MQGIAGKNINCNSLKPFEQTTNVLPKGEKTQIFTISLEQQSSIIVESKITNNLSYIDIATNKDIVKAER